MFQGPDVPTNRVIIAGGRDFNDYGALHNKVMSITRNIRKHQNLEVVSGGAKGADQLGERWGLQYEFPVAYIKPDWDQYGKSAAFRRNVEMANYADFLIAFWDGNSRGTEHMINCMRFQNKPYRIIPYQRHVDPVTEEVSFTYHEINTHY